MLHRLMRALAHRDVLSVENDGRLSLTPLGEALRSDAPGEALENARPAADGEAPVFVAELVVPGP
ncbi:MAG: hypothetical protein ACOC83_01925, partial [Gemmatimonadota bacterium]